MEDEMVKKCTRCNSMFVCTPHDCWCGKLPNVIPLPRNGGCLCPSCLQKEIKNMVKEKYPDGL
jgi:hypothetical protein